MYKNILIAIDGSDHSFKALDRGAILAEKFGSDLHVLFVTPQEQIVEQAPMIHTGSIKDAIKNAGEEIISRAKGMLKDFDLDVNYEHTIGKVHKEIMEYAHDNDVSLIVIGSRGLGGLTRTLLGSVSTKVVNTSDISVLVVK